MQKATENPKQRAETPEALVFTRGAGTWTLTEELGNDSWYLF